MDPEPEEFDARLMRCIGEISVRTTDSGAWHRISDSRAEPAVEVRRTWFRRRRVETLAQRTVRCPASIRSAHEMLVRCQSRVSRLMLPTDDTLPAQVHAALLQTCEYAEAAGTYADAGDAQRSWETEAAMMLAGRVAALVGLAEERERILYAIDDATLTAKAVSLGADNAEIRALLSR